MFPVLYRDDQIWQIQVKKTPPSIIIEYGKIGGKQQTSILEYTTGKNIGRKNETTPYEQAVKEATSKWKHKLRGGYHEKGETHENILPMLATPYNRRMTYPLYVQPKLDGLRCIIYKTDEIIFQSRTGSHFTSLEHIQLSDLFDKFPHLVLDGELYTDEIPFEQLAGLIKRKGTSDDTKLIKYHVYDIISTEPFYKRNSLLQKYSKLFPDNVIPVETLLIDSSDELKSKFAEYIDEGYEGIMLREPLAPYQHKRTQSLQKYKEFKEDEYTIIGYTEGTGRDKSTVIWICQATEPFYVRPKGTNEYRQQLLIDADKYIGKKLTVIYQELTENGIPRFPVGKAIREDY
jgi:DNA ligase-1